MVKVSKGFRVCVCVCVCLPPAVRGKDKLVNVWDIKKQEVVATLSGHEGEVKAAICFCTFCRLIVQELTSRFVLTENEFSEAEQSKPNTCKKGNE